ncbi:YdeI/OmpD-associated family protein [Microvirga rosea]|uniref:YdeI/OmpD-associated family protein n=1 Tax=Microvirga rosea TaxID=2715425 RepID=UPI001D09C72C|nr:YdeI/OmpD-associated family protein [Microvirga rosea]MCB8823146.1 YdeI/OmpD-associated family protein [Microvirga rosea]
MALKRKLVPMPDDVRARLKSEGLERAYAARPPYQRNDYLWWIGDAKRAQTRNRRLEQMLEELRFGNRYMGMAYNGSTGQAEKAG